MASQVGICDGETRRDENVRAVVGQLSFSCVVRVVHPTLFVY
jgi:hypothetical protein